MTSYLQERKVQLLQAALMIVVGWWIYAPVLHGAWVGDDSLYITKNPLLNEPGRVWKAWFQPGSFIEYYPLHETLQWAQWKLWGDDPFGYHITNVVLHLISAFLVWRLLGKFGLRLAWLGGLIFVVHPVMVESVQWISEFKNTLSLPPFLLAMSAWVDYENGKRDRDYWLALAFFVVSMLCKLSPMTFPVVILLYAWWKRDRITWNDLKASTPFLLVSLTLTAISIYSSTRGMRVGTGVPIPTPHLGGFFSRVALAGQIIAFYFTKSLVPISPSGAYYEWPVDPHRPAQFLPWVVMVGVFFWLWKRRDGWGRHALLGLGFFLIMAAPVLGFITVSYMLSSWVYDHLIYIPIIGLIGLVVAGLDRLGDLLNSSVRFCGAFVVAVTLTFWAWESRDYAGVWVTEEGGFVYNLNLNPDNALLHSVYGNFLDVHNRAEEALRQYQEAVQVDPTISQIHFNLALGLLKTGHPNECMAEIHRALEIAPSYGVARMTLGEVLESQGRPDEAIIEYRKTIEINPKFAEAHDLLGLSLLRKGQTDEAIAHFQAALAAKPALVVVHKNLGNALMAESRFDEAVGEFQEAIKAAPNDADMHTCLGLALWQKGAPDQAIVELQQAVTLRPGSVPARANLAEALARRGRLEEAIAQFQQAVAIDPHDAELQAALNQVKAAAQKGAVTK